MPKGPEGAVGNQLHRAGPSGGRELKELSRKEPRPERGEGEPVERAFNHDGVSGHRRLPDHCRNRLGGLILHRPQLADLRDRCLLGVGWGGPFHIARAGVYHPARIGWQRRLRLNGRKDDIGHDQDAYHQGYRKNESKLSSHRSMACSGGIRGSLGGLRLILELPATGNRIAPCTPKRVAAEQTPESQPAASGGAILVDGLLGIYRASGREAARRRGQRRHRSLIESDQPQEGLCEHNSSVTRTNSMRSF